jgi:hypothetical protein
MIKRIPLALGLGALALAAVAPFAAGLPAVGAAGPPAANVAPQAQRPNPFSDAWLAANHGKFDNAWTAEYETRQQKAPPSGPLAALKAALGPLYGPDSRMSNGNVLGSSENEFQIDINPTDSNFAIGTSNGPVTAGVGVFRTTDRGVTWSSFGAPIGTSACCDPAVAYAYDGTVYVGVLDTSPAGEYVIKSTDNGATWGAPVFVPMPDRNNLAVDNGPTSPRRGTVYTTYSDLPATNRIKGYKSTDGGLTWGASFFIGDTAPAQGYEQSSQPQVASDGTLYVGYQQYTNSNVGCSAGVQNVLAKSTDGGATFTYTVLPITQGGSCSSAQAGRGLFCINAAGTSSFRSRSFPVIGTSPTNPQHVYMVYSGGDLETPYTCQSAAGFHSDTLFRRSTDGGATFSAPLKINSDPAGKDQYFPWMDVAPNGTIWAGWNDRREDPNNVLSRWYQAFSTDEGATWSESPVADVQTQPSTFIGDYHGLAATNDVTLGMWYDSRVSAAGDAYTDPNPPVQGTPTATATTAPTQTATPTTTATTAPTQTATPSSTAGPSNTPVPSSTAGPSNTPAPPTATRTAAPSATRTVGPTETPCGITFSDVHPTDYFYIPVQYLACHGVISGYADGTFRPYANTTRGQMVKIVVNAFNTPGYSPPNTNTFADVLPSNPFFVFIEAAAHANIVSGYACGGPGEPCDAQNRPYFRPFADVTRGQLSKIVVTAASFTVINPASATFADVFPNTAFYTFVETAYAHQLISGYSCGGAGEPCDGQNRPYFRQYNNATRGQIAKIVYNALTLGPPSR